MKRLLLISLAVLIVVASTVTVSAAPVTLTAVTFPERRTVKLPLAPTPEAPKASVEAKVDFQQSQAEIELKYDNMKPAILFGGDITCYVVWAISQDGTAENLGELWMPKPDGKLDFATGRKSFALVITAEPYSLVERPSAFVMFSNRASDDKHATNTSFVLENPAPTADHAVDSIRDLAWDSSVPLDLHEAEKAVELARREGADTYSPIPFRDATIALSQARTLSAATKAKAGIDYSRRATARASEAIQVTMRKKQAEELQRQIEARRAEMKALDERAQAAEQRSADAERRSVEAEKRTAEADQKAAAAQTALATANAALVTAQAQQAAAQQQVEATQLELDKMATDKQALVDEQAKLTASMADLRQQTESLRSQSEQLKAERDKLSSRLQGALSEVAETRDSARGFIVNLPDILFDVNKATLKPQAQLVIAKLTGILLIMPELNLRIEGHTDSQGSDEYNQRLSEARADSVKSFLESNGINNRRMTAVGYGESRPVADNQNAAGRQKNRRVEIVISQGDIAGAEAESGQ